MPNSCCVTVDITAKASHYDISIDQNMLSHFKDYIPDNLQDARRFVICDTNTRAYADQIAGGAPVYECPAGEKAKSFEVLQAVTEWCLSHHIDRKSVIIAVGGGVTGDLAGFVAAIVMRGVSVIQVPTTLLAMVDSSVGGKTGINTQQGKNLVGAFHQPESVICDINVLNTLPERELQAGYAEILKYGLLGDADFYEWLEDHGAKVLARDPEAVKYAVQRSCEMKAAIVKADEKELSGQRALLNLGHTFAHAFEAVMGYDGRLLHGEAVAVGMVCAMELSVQKGHLNAQVPERIVQHMQNIGLKTKLADIGLPEDATPEQLLKIMRGDKKADRGKIKFILLNRIGAAFVSDEVAGEDVLAYLDKIM